MSTSISTSFIRQYEREVHQVFQRKGGYLRPTVRTKDNVVGSSTTFQKIGTGVATTKSRHGVITPMNQAHTAIECTLSDFYAGDWVDKLDEAKINIDERMAIAEGGAWALGRKVDAQLITSMTATTQTTVTWTLSTDSTIENGLLESVQALDTNDVPNDGSRYVVIGPIAWSFAMKVEQFASGDYVGSNGLPFTEGAPGFNKWKQYLGCLWTSHTGVTGVGGASAEGYAYHKRSLGYATGAVTMNQAEGSGQQVHADITWHGDRAAHFVNHWMSGGSCNIDDTGTIQLAIDETASLPTS